MRLRRGAVVMGGFASCEPAGVCEVVCASRGVGVKGAESGMSRAPWAQLSSSLNRG